ncbi:transposase [Salinispora arenicola]|uniref:transposase n=1 Tax=Salinispora arenicola TaxID=168697 RepID=UPI00355832F4
MPRRYPPGFGRKVLDLLKAGRSVAELVWDLEISDQTIYNWRRQDLIDTGQVSGVTSAGNGMIESFWGRTQTELRNRRRWRTDSAMSSSVTESEQRGLGRPGVAGRSRPAAGLPVFATGAPGRGTSRGPGRSHRCPRYRSGRRDVLHFTRSIREH